MQRGRTEGLPLLLRKIKRKRRLGVLIPMGVENDIFVGRATRSPPRFSRQMVFLIQADKEPIIPFQNIRWRGHYDFVISAHLFSGLHKPASLDHSVAQND